MTPTERFSKFNEPLQKAFIKMILGVNVEITKECRNSSKYYKDSGKWFFITSINEDETIEIQNDKHQVFSGLKLKDIKL